MTPEEAGYSAISAKQIKELADHVKNAPDETAVFVKIEMLKGKNWISYMTGYHEQVGHDGYSVSLSGVVQPE